MTIQQKFWSAVTSGQVKDGVYAVPPKKAGNKLDRANTYQVKGKRGTFVEKGVKQGAIFANVVVKELEGNKSQAKPNLDVDTLKSMLATLGYTIVKK